MNWRHLKDGEQEIPNQGERGGGGGGVLAWSLMKGGLEALQSHWKEGASNFQSTSW